MKWLFVRHGEIESNKRRVYAGWSEEGLTSKGCHQAIETARMLSDCNIGAIYCSPLERTVQTAEIIGSLLGKKPIICDSFKELKLGTWEGKSEEEIRNYFPKQWNFWSTKPAEFVLEERETLHELLERALYGVKKIKEQPMNGNVLVVTHVAIIRALGLYAENLDLNLYGIITHKKAAF